MSDPVDHPIHYSRWKMEPIEFIMINDLAGWLANVIKYAMRYDAKDGLQDLYKARSYLDMKIRQLEGITRYWEKPVREQRALAPGAITKVQFPGQAVFSPDVRRCICGLTVTNHEFTCGDACALWG